MKLRIQSKLKWMSVATLAIIITISGSLWLNDSGKIQLNGKTELSRVQKKAQRKKGRMDYLINRLADPKTVGTNQ